MKHADLVIQRILFLEGVPHLADYDRILVGTTPREQLRNDLALEHATLAVLRPGIALCLEIWDHGTRDLLERILVDEEHHVDWIEAQEHKIAEVGYQQYLAQ
jgi:bacterioferritin